jgi:Uncharacterized conserved protein
MKTKVLFYSIILTLVSGVFFTSCCNQSKTEESCCGKATACCAAEDPNVIKIVAVVTLKDAAFASEFESALKAVVEGTNTEEGNIYYASHQDINNPLTYVIIESWKSQDAIDYHNETPHFKAFVAALGDNADLTINTIKLKY